MIAYIARRLVLMVVTIFGIMLISFAIVQLAPGGPVETMLARLSGTDVGISGRLGGSGDLGAAQGAGDAYRGSQGMDAQLIEKLKKQYGFDRPAHERFIKMIADYARFDFGKSLFGDESVIALIRQKLPVSMSLGLWILLLSYAISIPLGIRKAVKDGSRFDIWTSMVITIGYALPGFLVAVVLLIVFAGGSFYQIFPPQGLWSENWNELSLIGKIGDYFWHLALPITAMVLAAFANLTLLTKNSFLEEIGKQYVLTARMKGLTERQVLYGHVFRNAMLLVIAGFPAAFIHAFFTGSLLIEVTFNLDGLGLLSYNSIIGRDYTIVFGSLYIFSLIGLFVNLVSDLIFTMIDPRIDFESREV
ncbi:MAG: microcin C ABC transporter permease YejB [Beijerinckiaceae bacterium]|nr:microcin C ABC transporter permease YejB [Beijerinckiaceae bacterium]